LGSPANRGSQRVPLGHPPGVMVEWASVMLDSQVEPKTVGVRLAQGVAHEDHVAF
jgi:hypothetical protein